MTRSDNPSGAVQDRVGTAATPGAPRGSRGTGWLIEAAAYLGGGLMLGGAALVLAESWDQLTRQGRSALFFGVALILAAAAVLAAGGGPALLRLSGAPPSPRRRVVGVLLALVAVPVQPAAAFALPDPYARTGSAVAALAVSVTAMAILATTLGVLITAWFSVGAAVYISDELWVGEAGTRQGLTLAAVGALWLAASLSGRVRPRPLGIGIGAFIAIVGGQIAAGDADAPWVGHATTLAVGLVCLLLHRVVRDVMLIISGMVALCLGVPEVVWDLSNRFSLALIAFGAVWIATGLARLIQPRGIGLGIGSISVLIGCQVALFDPRGIWVGYTATVLAALICLVSYRGMREVVLLIAAVFGLSMGVPEAVADLTDRPGMATLALGVLWLVLGMARLLRPRGLAFGLGCATALLGGQIALTDPYGPWVGYTTTLAVALACLVLYQWMRTRVLIVAGVLGITAGVPEAVYDLTGGRVSGALIVLVGGAALITASVIGLRLNRA